MSHDYEKDLEIIEAALSIRSLSEVAIDGWSVELDTFNKCFTPSYTKQLVEKAMERDALVKKLEDFIHLDTEREAERRDLVKRVEELEGFIDECLFHVTDQKQECIDGGWFKMMAKRLLK